MFTSIDNYKNNCIIIDNYLVNNITAIILIPLFIFQNIYQNLIN